MRIIISTSMNYTNVYVENINMSFKPKYTSPLERFKYPIERYTLRNGVHPETGELKLFVWDTINLKPTDIVLDSKSSRLQCVVDELNRDYNIYHEELQKYLRGVYLL